MLLVNGKRIDGVPSEKMLTELVDAALAAKPVSERAETGRQWRDVPRPRQRAAISAKQP